ncbi:MAG TPA: hypothetical protein VNN80_11450 [Polyangiaceae bacterium]|nr:hypothetical protein [Polyangiaceae bacterium]
MSSQPESEPPHELRAPDDLERAAPPAHGAKRRAGLTFMVCSLMMVASLLSVIWNLQDSSLDNANTGSRYATVESLVDYGTYYIDRSRYVRTIDKYSVGEHYISSKPPTLPTLGAGVYWVYQRLTGKTIARYEGDVVRTVSFCTGGLCHVLFLIYFYRLCRLLFRRRLAVMTAMAGACFAYLGVGYATHINNHSTAAALAVTGLYYAARIRQQRDVRPWHWPLAGFALGVLPAIDLPGLAITGALGLYLLSYDWKKTLLWFAPALLPGLLAHMVLTYQISGSLKPFYFNSELKTYGQFYFRKPSGIDALREPKLTYAFHTLLGHHGLFSMTPLYFFGAYELVRSMKARRLLAESLVVLGSVLAFMCFFIWRTRNYGGWCVGMRWYVPIMPFLLLYFGIWVDRVRMSRPLWAAVLVAFGVSAFNVQDALSSPFQYSVWHNWLEGAPNRARVGKLFNLPKRGPKSKAKAKAPKAKAPVSSAPPLAPSAPVRASPEAPLAPRGSAAAAGAAGTPSRE